MSEAPLAALGEYARIPMTLTVRRVLDCAPAERGFGGLRLTERELAEPYVKDYDADAGEGPERWAARFDVGRWGVLLARDGARAVGGAVIAWDTPELHMLEGRRDLAVLWDLRVEPGARGRGVGTLLFGRACAWAAARGCRTLKVETQSVNVPACRFYAARGCVLGGINRYAYPELPHETQLLWYRELGGAG